MRNFFKLFRKEPLWDFQGGIHPPEMKTQSNGTPLRQLPLPARFIVPVKQHIGHEGELLVRPGDKVLRGQPLTFGRGRMLPVHAPTSGTVDAIAPHMTAHPSGLSETCVFITPDGEDRWVEKQPLPAYQQAERATLVEMIHQAGVAGLGGAGFPTATKLKGGLRGVKTLIINAAECEPYITADDRLMQDCADEIIEGSRILAWVLQSERVMIGIEDNKPEAIAALKKALGGATDIQVRVIPTKYPSGGAKQLTKILTGLEVPHGGRSTDIGVLMQNVGTAYAVKRAIVDGEALTERVVTLTGESVKRPGNVWGRIGTPISHLLHQADFTPTAGQMVVMGGPLMGFTLPTLDVPVVKITNCILAPSASEMGDSEEEKSCIRCSACADACPAALLPQQLYWYSRGGDHDKAREHNIADCIECGACAYVCPSNIPLVQYYRQEKAEIRAIDLEAERTAQAKARFEARQARLEREKLAREARHQQAKRTVNQSEGGEVTAALARVKAKKQAENAQAAAPGEVEDASLIAQREARKAAARAQTAEKRAETEPATRQTVDPRKAAVQAAIARAKAKKTATDIPHSPELAVSAETAVAAEINAEAVLPAEASAPVDPRKAAVEAAIARAKAKKAAAAVNGAARGEAERVEAPDEAAPAEPAKATEPADPRKAAVEAAIARVKAKKAAAAWNGAARGEAEHVEAPDEAAPAEPAEATEPADPRKAAVEAAIARVKAKKAAAAEARSEAERTETPDEAVPAEAAEATEPADPRKAAVEAAIARVKAKKATAGNGAARGEAERVEAPGEVAPAEPAKATEPADPRKAAVAAAIARVKAKKAAAGNGELRHEPATENNDAAAAQNVEARHNAVTGSEGDIPSRPSAVTQDGTSDSDDPRKAAVAAAIARVKARRAQHSTQED